MNKQYFLLGLSLFFGFFFGLSSYGLLNNNEGLYAQISWETLVDNHWIIPTLNGVPYIEKPPLLYWLIASAFKVFRKSVWVARLIPALAGIGTVLISFWFFRSLKNPSRGFLTAFILSTSLGFCIFSRMVFFDVLLTFLLSASLFHFFIFYVQNKKFNLLCMWFFLALCTLAKGFVGPVLAGGIILIFLTVEHKISKIWHLFNPYGIALFLVMTVPWHVMACLQNDHFAWFYFINEHVLRFLDLRVPKDYYTGSVFYYIPRLLAYTFPWGAIFLFQILKKIKNIKLSIKLKSSLRSWFNRPSLEKFLWTWFAIVFIFFSVSKAKANYYLVTAMPPLCALLALKLSNISVRALAIILILNAGVITIAVQLMPIYEDRFSTVDYFKKNKYQPSENFAFYKRFEEMSSFVFYAHHPIPIINSESRDLWFGKKCGYAPPVFIDSHQPLVPTCIVVLKRDWGDFESEFPSYNCIFVSKQYKIFKKV